MRDQMCNLAISFGGTKVALGLVPAGGTGLLAQTGRIEWRNHSAWIAADPLYSLFRLVSAEAEHLLESATVSIRLVDLVGIAWPGPGSYSEGRLAATFIPGLDTARNVHELLRESLLDRFGSDAAHLRMVSRLDAAARARGELRMPDGAFYCKPEGPWLGVLLNIATGIAAAFVQDGKVLDRYGAYGETYGQWGRYLFRRHIDGGWTWRATPDGSVPAFDRHAETRLTELCAGPALVARWSGSRSVLRDISAERETLQTITRDAYQGGGASREFVAAVGREIGEALACLLDALSPDQVCHRIVLAGGVGENFGRPPASSRDTDLLLAGMSAALARRARSIVRSMVGLEGELVGFA